MQQPIWNNSEVSWSETLHQDTTGSRRIESGKSSSVFKCHNWSHIHVGLNDKRNNTGHNKHKKTLLR